MRLRTLLTWALLGAALGCTPPDDEELRDEDLKLSVPWQDLSGAAAKAKDPSTSLASRQLDSLPQPPQLTLAPRPTDEPPRSPLRLTDMSQHLGQPVAYEGGLYGRMGSSRVFLASRSQIKDDDHLYFVMVKVLSEKYGCFIRVKRAVGAVTRVVCRDGRQVQFWRSAGPDWVGFRARQFDERGREMIVVNHKITYR